MSYVVSDLRQTGPVTQTTYWTDPTEPCRTCKGTGRLPEVCEDCNGTGCKSVRVRRKETTL